MAITFIIVIAAPGDRDLGFGADGVVSLPYPTGLLTEEASGSLLVAQVDGLINPNGGPTPITTRIARYSPDGVRDSSLNIQIENFFPAAMLATPDGKIVLVGNEGDDPVIFVKWFVVWRYNADGTPDTTFGKGGRAIAGFKSDYGNAAAAALQPDGKLLVAGTLIPESQDANRIAIARFTVDGALDTDFAQTGRFAISFEQGEDEVRDLLVQPDGKILLAIGVRDDSMARYDEAIGLLRLNPDGTPDADFGDAGRSVIPLPVVDECTAQLTGIDLALNGQIVAGGRIRCPIPEFVYQGIHWRGGLMSARLTSTGDLDPAYGAGGISIIKFGIDGWSDVNALALDSAGRLVLAGSIGNNFGLSRLTPSGALDPDFGDGGLRRHSLGLVFDNAGHGSLLLRDDGAILTAGNFSIYPPRGEYQVNGVLARFQGGEAAPASNPPGAFYLEAPQDAQRVVSLLGDLPKFAWTRSDEATDYTVDVYKLSGNVRVGLAFSATVDAGAGELVLNDEQRALLTPGLYLWTVTAANSLGNIEAVNAGRTFTVYPSAAEPNLVPNSSFEQKPDRYVAYWDGGKPKAGDGRVCKNPGATGKPVAATGRCALRFTAGAGKVSTYIISFRPATPIAPGETLTLSAAVRNVSARQFAEVIKVSLYDEAGFPPLIPVLQMPKRGADYQTVTFQLPFNYAIHLVQIEVTDRGARGTFFVDDIKLLRNPSGAPLDAPAQQPSGDLRGSN